MTTYRDNHPYNIEAPQKLFIEYSHDITWDYTTGQFPDGTEDAWDWENAYIPIPHLINGREVGRHEWMRIKVGVKSNWTYPIRFAANITNINAVTAEVVIEEVSYTEFIIILTFTDGSTVSSEPIRIRNGQDGIGIVSTEVRDDGFLYITYTNGIIENAGRVRGDDANIPPAQNDDWLLSQSAGNPIWISAEQALGNALNPILPIEYNFLTGNLSHNNTDGYMHLPPGGNIGEHLINNGPGSGIWTSISGFKISSNSGDSFASFEPDGTNEYLTIKGTDPNVIFEAIDASDVRKMVLTDDGYLQIRTQAVGGTYSQITNEHIATYSLNTVFGRYNGVFGITVNNPVQFEFLRHDVITADNAFLFNSDLVTDGLNSSTAEQSYVGIEATINQTGTAAYNALKIDAIETSLGSGASGDGNNLLNLAVAGTSQFRVSNKGSMYLLHTNDDITGIVFKDSIAWIHDFSHPTGATAVPIGDNVFIGENSGNFTTGSTATQSYQASLNTGIGQSTLFRNTTGFSNTAVGNASLSANTSGNNNTGVGNGSLTNNTIGFYNTAVGASSLFANILGDYNTAFGLGSGYNSINNYNVFVGYNAGYFETASNKLYISSITSADQVDEATAKTKAIIYGEQNATTANQKLWLNAETTVRSKVIIDPDENFGTDTGLWFGNGDTGFYEGADDNIYININSSPRWIISSTRMGKILSNGGAVLFNVASNTVPSLVPYNNNSTSGIGGTGTDVSLIVNGIEGIRVNSTLAHSVAGITDYETLVVNDDDIPNKKYVDDNLEAFIPKSTSVLYGGELSINGADPTTFDIAAGRAVFVDNYTDPENPTYTYLDIPAQTGISVTNIGTQLVTWINLSSTGTINQAASALNSSEMREFLELGILVHTNLTSIESTNSVINLASDVDLKINDIAIAISPRLVTEGLIVSANGNNLKIDISAGKTFGLGLNYDNDKQDPNYKIINSQTALTFLTAYNGPVIGSSSDVDTANYDPGGLGVLTALPTGAVTTHGIFYSPDTGTTVVHYGQYIYDSIKEGIDSWEKEEYSVIAELGRSPLIGVLVFVAGATDLSDPTQAKFITPGIFGFINRSKIPDYADYASYDKTISGMSYKRPDVTIVEDTGVLYAEVETLGGGDFIVVFGEDEYVLNCTTGSGTGGKARVALTAGSATVPQKNYIYIEPSSTHKVAQLVSSTSYPTGEIVFVMDCALPDITTFGTEGPYQSRRWTDAKEFDGRSSMARTSEWIRRRPSEWDSGVLQTVTVDTVPSPDSVNFESTAGIVWQKHRQTFPAFDISTDGIYIANHPTTPYTKIYDLNDVEALQTSDGTTLSATRFNWVIWGCISKTTGECKLFLNLPTDSYATDSACLSDSSNYAVTSVPTEFRGVAFLIARLPFRHTTPGGGQFENLANTYLSLDVIDLRGKTANIAGGATSPPLGTSFEDLVFNIYNTLAGFQFRFDASNLTADRIYTEPDESGTHALEENTAPNYVTNSSFDWDTYSPNRAEFLASSTNGPLGSTVAHGLFIPHSSGATNTYGTVIVGRFDDDVGLDSEEHLFFRNLEAGVWTEWMEILHQNNYSAYNSFDILNVDESQNFGSGTGIAFGDGDTIIREESDDELAFITAGTEAVRIDNSGNVGIGTTSPASLLNVYSNDTTYASIIENHYGGDTGYGIWVDTRWNTPDNIVAKFTTNSGVSNVMILKGNGNVGIGTTNPGCALDIGGTGSMRVRGSAAASTGEGLELAYATNTSYVSSYDRTGGVYKNMVVRGSTIDLSIDGTSALDLDTNGYINIPGVYTEAATYTPNVYVASDGSLRRNSSSKKIKKDIDYKGVNPNLALKFKPVSFTSKLEEESKHLGFIAEDMKDLDFRLIQDGDLPGLDLGGIVSAMSATIIKQDKEIVELREKINTLENKINKIYKHLNI